MDKLSTLLPKVLNKRGIKHEADASLVVHTANTILQKKGMHEACEASTFTRGTLFIEVTTSIAAQEAHSTSDELLRELKTKFPTIESIRIIREKTPSNRK